MAAGCQTLAAHSVLLLLGVLNATAFATTDGSGAHVGYAVLAGAVDAAR